MSRIRNGSDYLVGRLISDDSEVRTVNNALKIGQSTDHKIRPFFVYGQHE